MELIYWRNGLLISFSIQYIIKVNVIGSFMKNRVGFIILVCLLVTIESIALIDVEKEVNAPAREMEMMDDAMNRGIAGQRERNENVFLPLGEDEKFDELLMLEFVLEDNIYILKKIIEDVNNTTVSIEVKNGMLTIKSVQKIKAITIEKEAMLGKGTDADLKYFESKTSESLSLPKDANIPSLVKNYENGVLKIMIQKK